jgi:uncharacterized protein YkwD
MCSKVFSVRFVFSISMLFAFVACGHEDSSTPRDTNSADAEAVLGNDNQVNLEEFTLAFNDYRARNGRAALIFSQSLTNNAAQNNRIQNSRGLGHFYMGPGTMRQNSAWNYGSSAAVLNGWHNSSGHRVNMLDTSVRCFGIHWLGSYWTMDLGNC